MAGLYPDVPGHRIAYDRDGSVAVSTTGATPTSLTDTEIANLNMEGAVGHVNTSWDTKGLGVIFPVPYDIVGAAILYAAGANDWNVVDVQTSVNTTNLVDGTWVVRGTGNTPWKAANWRENIASVSWSGIKAVKYHCNSSGSNTRRANIHLYGTPSAGYLTNRLVFWHPTDSAHIGPAYFDWGDTPRNAEVTKTFRIGNPSADTANGVTLTREALTDGDPANVNQYTFSLDGITWSSSLNIGNLAPGAVSPVVTVRRQVPSNAPLSLWAVRLVASATSYS
jgi:hypothetical protein